MFESTRALFLIALVQPVPSPARLPGLNVDISHLGGSLTDRVEWLTSPCHEGVRQALDGSAMRRMVKTRPLD